MEVLATLVALVVAVAVIATPFLSFAAFFGQRALRRDVERLQAELAALRAAAAAVAMPEATTEAPAAAAAASQPAPAQAEPAPEPAAPPRRRGWPEPTHWAPLPQTPAGTGPQAAAPDARESLEERLTARWLVWLGAATLALAGVFLVKLAIDAGLVGPAVRIGLGFLLGTILAAGGELLRRRSPATGPRPDYVPAALVAAGVFTLFASTYAAHTIYGFMGSTGAFLALAVVALLAVAAALLHGPLVALLGLLGGYATPLLVAGTSPEAVPVFAYLAVLTAALVAVGHRVRWWPLAWLTLAVTLAWPAFWLLAVFAPGDATALGSYLLAIAAISVLPLRFTPPADLTAAKLPLAHPPSLLALAAAIGAASCLWLLASIDRNGTAALLAIAAFVLGSVAVARRLPGQEGLLAPAVVLVLALLAVWQLPVPPFAPPPTAFRAPLLPPGIDRFVVNAAGYALLFGAGGFVLWRGARLPLVWAGLSAAMPVLILCIAYWRVAYLEVDLRWTPLALALAALAVAAAAGIRRRPPAEGQDDLLACYAAAAVAALALAATMALREAWLSVALAMMLPALGWVMLRLRSRRLAQLAAIVALVVLARLVLNPFVLDYDLGTVPTLGWVAYGYGLPALAFFAASRLFRRCGEPWLVALLEGGAIAFAVLLGTLEIQLRVAGDLASWPGDLLVLGLQSIAWLAVALALIGQEAWFTGAIVRWARWLLAGLALLQSLLLQVLVFNPLWTDQPVGALPILNLLLPAYALPAALAIWYGRREKDAPRLAMAASLAGLVLAFVFVTLSVRHAFHGSDLTPGLVSNAEGFSYSGAWLIFAAVLLALGIRRASTALRWASLAMLLLTAAKVFLLDMGDLAGLWRVASFLGLGLSLVAIGFVYQRFVFPAGQPAAGPAPTAAT